MLTGYTVLPNSEVTRFGSSYQEASPSTAKNAGAVVVLYHAWNCVPTAPSGVDISKMPGFHLL